MVFRSVAIIIFSFGILTSTAQDDMRVRRLSVENGLSQSAISCMLQDSTGYLWIGTRDGLNRYDGSTFKIYRNIPRDTASISSNIIVDMVLDVQGQMWIATENALNLYHPLKDVFISYPVPDSYRTTLFSINDIVVYDSTTIAFASNNGILFFDTSSKKFFIPNDYAKLKGLQITRISKHRARGLIILAPYGVIDEHLTPMQTFKEGAEGYAGRVFCTHSGDIFFSKNNQVFKYHESDSTVDVFHTFRASQVVYEIKENIDGEIWVGTDRLVKLDKDGDTIYELAHSPYDPFSLSGSFISCITSTRDGSMWIGTNGFGLNQIDNSMGRFGYLSYQPGLPYSLSSAYVNSVCSKNDTIVYVSTGVGGVDELNTRTKTSRRILLPKGQENNVVFTMAIHNDKLIAGSASGVYQLENKSFSPVVLLRGESIYCIESIKNDNVLIATNTSIRILNPATGKVFFNSTFPKQVINSYPVHFSKNTIWDGSQGFLRKIQLHGEIETSFDGNIAGLNVFSGGIKSITQDYTGTVWVGTWGHGIIRLDSMARYLGGINSSNGLPNDVVYGALEDDRHNLWLSTNKGLSCLNIDSLTTINFEASDGLQGDEFNTGSYFRSDYGKFYFGGTKGLTSFRPQEVLLFSNSPPVPRIANAYLDEVLTSLPTEGINAAVIQSSGELTIKPSVKSFGFQVSSISFMSAQKTIYRYSLEPFQTKWIYLGHRDFINFTNIPAGNYVFKLQAAHSNGAWSTSSTVNIKVLAPVWKNVWFIISVSALAISIAGGVNYFRVRALRKRTMELEMLVAERTREIETQNEELSSQSELLMTQNEQLSEMKVELEKRVTLRTNELTAINSDLLSKNTQLEQFSFIIAHNLNGPVARIKGLMSLLKLGQSEKEINSKLTESVDDLDQVIKDLNQVLNLMYGVEKHFESITLGEQLNGSLKILEQDIKKSKARINVDIPEALRVTGSRAYLHSIFYNLIHNAIKYAKANATLVLTITACREENMIVMKFDDNGIGINMRYAQEKLFKIYQRFEPKIPGRGLGLFLVKTQVEIMGGTIGVESTHGQGTTFTLRLVSS